MSREFSGGNSDQAATAARNKKVKIHNKTKQNQGSPTPKGFPPKQTCQVNSRSTCQLTIVKSDKFMQHLVHRLAFPPGCLWSQGCSRPKTINKACAMVKDTTPRSKLHRDNFGKSQGPYFSGGHFENRIPEIGIVAYQTNLTAIAKTQRQDAQSRVSFQWRPFPVCPRECLRTIMLSFSFTTYGNRNFDGNILAGVNGMVSL